MLLPLFAVLIVALVWAMTLNLIKVEREGAKKAAAASTRELVDTYEAHAVRVMHEIDKTLKLVQYAHEQKGRGSALEDLKGRSLLPPGLLFMVSMADAKGDIMATTRPSHAMNVADQGHFQALRQRDALMVGLPQKEPRRPGWTLQFSRRLNGPDGSFDGAAIVSVDAAFFVSSYDESKLGKRGVLAIIGTDRVFRAMRKGETLSAGGVASSDIVLPEVSHDAEAEVSVRAMDSVRYYTSVRRLVEFPLAVLVGIAEEEHFETSTSSWRTYLWWAVASTVLLLALGASLSRMSWQLVQSRRRIIEEQVAHAERVEYLAYHDSLTQLPNRSLFSKLLNQGIRQAQLHERRLAVMFLDLDGFKHINDTLGHEAGDRLLQEIAARLKSCLSEGDVVARLGGDEFVILLPHLPDETHPMALAQKILRQVARPVELHSQEFHVTASVGVSLYPRDGQDEQTLTKHADIAMYKAKQSGKNNYQFYSEKMNVVSIERLALEARLRQALDCEEFELHYQEKRDILNRHITGVEALLRWQHPELGVLAPADFLAVAEETGLIVPLGRWILTKACAQVVDWQKQGLPSLSIAVNLTARQFTDDNLLSDVQSALDATGLAPHLLELEIGESVLIQDMTKNLDILARLKGLGVRIAIDDFGVGYSSLSMLKKFPLDTIKIDRSFIRDIIGSTEGKNLASAVIAMGRSISSMVIGQGIETGEQAELLRTHACDELQGFYFSVPAPASEFQAALRARLRTEAT